MQKLIRYLFLTILALCMYIPSSFVEAANIVVIPVINNVDYPEVESTYYDNVIDCIKRSQKYDYVDNDAITAIIDKYAKKGSLPDQAAMQRIAEETNADLVVAMELDKLNYEPTNSTHKDSYYEIVIDGKTASYNVNDGKYVLHPFGDREELEYAFYVRTNVPLKWWSNTIQHEMHRVMDFKGLALQKPRITKLGNHN